MKVRRQKVKQVKSKCVSLFSPVGTAGEQSRGGTAKWAGHMAMCAVMLNQFRL